MKIGEKIRQAIVNSPYTVTEIAEKLGTSNQNLYKIFKKDSVDSKYLEGISKLLKLNISFFFENTEDSSPNLPTDEEKRILTNLKNEVDSLIQKNNLQEEMMSNLKKQVSILKIQIEDKEKIIDLLEEKIKILVDSRSISIHDLTTPKEERGLSYIDLDNAKALLDDFNKSKIDLSNQEEYEKFINEFLEKKVKNEKQKNE